MCHGLKDAEQTNLGHDGVPLQQQHNGSAEEHGRAALLHTRKRRGSDQGLRQQQTAHAAGHDMGQWHDRA